MAMAEMDRDTDKMLEALFSEARARPEAPGDGLMARVLGDALAEQAALAAPAAAPATAPGPARRGWSLWAALGGWPAVGGLATAAVVGLWIGFSPVLGLGDAVSGAVGTARADELTLLDIGSGLGFDLYDIALAGEEDAG